jgi:hypothetical protein
MNLSCYLISNGDFEFLETIIDNIQEVDEIIIVDGPFRYLANMASKGMPPQPLPESVKNNPKVKYFYVDHLEDEIDKRVYAQNKCTHDVVLFLDTDEVFWANWNEIQGFIDSDADFANCSIYNICLQNLYYGDKVAKFVLYRKSKFDSYEHLRLTWSLPFMDESKIPQFTKHPVLYKNLIGEIYHHSNNKIKKSSVIKRLHYTKVFYKSHNLDYNIAGFSESQLLEMFQKEEIDTVVYHSDPSCIGAIMQRCHRIPNPLINIEKYFDNTAEAYFRPMPVLNEGDCYFFLPKSLNHQDFTIHTQDVISVKYQVVQLNVEDYHETRSGEIVVEDNSVRIQHQFDNKDTAAYMVYLRCKIEGNFGRLVSIE